MVATWIYGITLIVLALIVFAFLIAGRNLTWWYHNVLRPVLSPFVNYSIYYVRKLFLRQTEKQARGEHYNYYLSESKRLHKMKQLPNIAVVNKNKEKYTETFIAMKVKGLKDAGYYVHQFYGGYFPSSEVHNGHLLSENDFVRDLVNLCEKIRNRKEGYYLTNGFIKYLKRHKITLVSAEFGTCAAEIYQACQKAGIPLIITFRGYDIHNRSIVNRYRKEYKPMLASAAHIIGVSQDIVKKVKWEFAVPDQKVTYLPSPTDPQEFPYFDHSQIQDPVFLSIGRFATTKSPHVLLLAFHEVLKAIPKARLVMVGQDEGGELFEASQIMAKALNIRDRIDFKGALPHRAIYREMQHARVFVQHSLTTTLEEDKEGTPGSVREAMLAGLPVVATRHAGIAELIEDGQTGVLVDEYDYQGMAHAMIDVCNSDEKVRELGKNASDSLRNNPLMTQNTEKLTQIIEQHRLP